MSKIIEGARQFFVKGRSVMHATSDGQYFYERGNAEKHGKERKLDLIEITQSDIDGLISIPKGIILPMGKVLDPLSIPPQPEIKLESAVIEKSNNQGKNKKRNGRNK